MSIAVFRTSSDLEYLGSVSSNSQSNKSKSLLANNLFIFSNNIR